MDPVLATPRGELSQAVVDLLTGAGGPVPDAAVTAAADPFGADLQLALYLCYELHYRGFAGVSEALEWDPGVLALRARLEERFGRALRAAADRRRDPFEALDDLLVEPAGGGEGPAAYLAARGELRHLREYAALRSLYHLKEADPHAWVIPRLRGRAKAAMAAVEFDEFGGGRADRVHARLYARLMADLGLDPGYGRYLRVAPAEALLVVNMMSLFGLHRSLRGALVGHFAAVEVSSPPASRKLAKAMERAGAGPAAVFFYTEHVEADAVHEQVVRREVVAGLLEDEPRLAADVAFGVDATVWAEERFGDPLVAAWRDGGTVLLGEV